MAQAAQQNGGASPADEAAAALATAGSAPRVGGARIRFTDKDEHMYFWFPLLAGLSELTFDPRPEIRCAGSGCQPCLAGRDKGGVAAGALTRFQAGKPRSGGLLGL